MVSVTGRKLKIQNVKKELKRLKLMDRKLISKKELYFRKMEKVSNGEDKKSKIGKFVDSYLTCRIKVGKKRLEFYDKLQQLIGKPKSVKVDDSHLDYMLNFSD